MLIYITGGVFPGNLRSTTIFIKGAQNVHQALSVAKQWAKFNFPDWNHMDRTDKAYPIGGTFTFDQHSLFTSGSKQQMTFYRIHPVMV